MATSDPDDGPPDDPDPWAEADRAWEAKWSDEPVDEPPDEGDLPHEGDPLATQADAPPPSDYRPRRATAGGTTGAYGDGMRAAGPYLGLGLQIGLSMVVFAGGGILLDRWLGTSPWGVLVGVALGMIGIVVLVLRVAKEEEERRKRGGPTQG